MRFFANDTRSLLERITRPRHEKLKDILIFYPSSLLLLLYGWAGSAEGRRKGWRPEPCMTESKEV